MSRHIFCQYLLEELAFSQALIERDEVSVNIRLLRLADFDNDWFHGLLRKFVFALSVLLSGTQSDTP